jgi:uncharacterized protein
MPHIDSHPAGSLFGMKVSDVPMGPDGIYTMLQLEGRDASAIYTMNAQQKAQGVPPNWLLYICVANADDAAKRAAAAGGTVLAPAFDVMEHGRMAMLQDPTGAVFAVWQPKKGIGAQITGVDGCVVWADLNTNDPARAKQFYSDVFGWKITAGDQDPSGYLHIQNGNAGIGGIPGPNQIPPGVPPHWMLYFQTSHCDASAAQVKQLGGQVHMGPMTLEKVGRFAVVADPQGAAFALFQPLPHG